MNPKYEKILARAHQIGGLSTAALHYIRRVFRKREDQELNPFRNHVKAGRVFGFSRHLFLGSRRAAAPYRQAAPIVDGVRMRWSRGKLVPRR